MLVALNLPNAPLKLTKANNELYVICLLRKKKIKLTPEEWVRQHIVYYLTAYKNYPASLIKIEHGIQVNKQIRRCDLVIYNRQGKAVMIVECKAPSVAISQLTFDQIAHYNHQLDTNYLFLTNGLNHAIFKINQDSNSLDSLTDLPTFETLNL